MKNKKILLLDKVHALFPDMLKSAGFEPHELLVDEETGLLNIIADYLGVVVRNAPKITAKTIDAGTSLKFIARAGSGLENIDVAHAERKGIRVFNSPEGNRDAVGEHALALTLCLLKKIFSSYLEVRNGIWQREPNRGSELMGKTVGIIGYGNTGSAFAHKLSGMGVEVLAYDKYKTGFSNNHVTEASLDEIQRRADIISFHVPLNEETRHYGNREFFARCVKSVIILNTSRGGVVSLSDLSNALKNGKVFGAGLDVVENESYHFNILQQQWEDEDLNFLLHHPSVIITPHIAGITVEAAHRHAEVLLKKILALNLS